MRTGMKVILAATSVAILASSAVAQKWNPTSPVRPDVSTDNVFWGEFYDPAYAYGSAGPASAGRFAPGVTVDGHPRILDCVHVTFPQCSGGAGGN
jgi:hypothetical protein